MLIKFKLTPLPSPSPRLLLKAKEDLNNLFHTDTQGVLISCWLRPLATLHNINTLPTQYLPILLVADDAVFAADGGAAQRERGGHEPPGDLHVHRPGTVRG